MAISWLHSILKVQMANCRHKEVILSTKLPRELGLSPGRDQTGELETVEPGRLLPPEAGPKAKD